MSRLGKKMEKLLETARYDSEKDFFLLKDGTLMNLVQIQSKDLVNSSDDEVEYDCLKFAKTYKLYADDIKIIALNFPCNTEKQQKYFRHQLANTKNEIFKSFLQKKLDELIWLGKHDTTREYYYMLFADGEKQMDTNMRILHSNLGSGKTGLISFLSEEKKQEVLYRMGNKCSILK